MPGTLLSPGIQTQEINLTTIVPTVATTIGGFAGFFRWGPVNQRILVDSETTMANILQPPNSNNAVFYWSAANFLDYGNQLQLVRANSAGLYNATANGAPSVMIPNQENYTYEYASGNSNVYGQWAAKYPGDLGNSLKVSICPGTQAFASNLTSTYGITATATVGSNLILTSLDVSANLVIGDLVQVGQFPVTNGYLSVLDIRGANVTLSKPPVSSNGSALTLQRKWQYASQFNGAPSTSAYANTKSCTNDQLHIVVVDANGAFHGSTSNNYILEKYSYASKAVDNKNNNSTPGYYPNILFNQSNYIYWMDFPSTVTNWGLASQGINFESPALPITTTLRNGSDITNPYQYTGVNQIGDTNNDGGLMTAWSYFQGSDTVEVDLLPCGPASITTQKYIVQNVAEDRLDCVAFLSPRYGDVVNQMGNEASNIVNNYLPSLGMSSTYAVVDSGWKYQYNKYSSQYEYYPLNSDIAGLCVYTDKIRAPYWSPAGYNRGMIKNVTKLAWNPSNGSQNPYRDLLYTNAVNPVVTFKNVGSILYGDKTLTSQPSAFDHINVRRLFIVMEKAISLAAKYSLFEFNDTYTRAAFVNMITPYLQQVQGGRGITAFYVQCDTKNNPPAVIQSNQFVGSIFVQPNYSINFITLQFTAVDQGVSFQTILGSSPPSIT